MTEPPNTRGKTQSLKGKLQGKFQKLYTSEPINVELRFSSSALLKDITGLYMSMEKGLQQEVEK